MIALYDLEQGTQEWHQARAGIPTASCFDQILTTAGVPSKSRDKYLYKLAAERIVGKSESGFQSDAMLRGQELEAEARAYYELTTDRKPIRVGICYSDDTRQIGASPDSLVDEEGLLEIKCPLAHTQVGYLLNEGLPTDYFQQVQGQLWVTGRKWADFVSYYPGLNPLVVRVLPDAKFHAALDAELPRFCADLIAITERIR